MQKQAENGKQRRQASGKRHALAAAFLARYIRFVLSTSRLQTDPAHVEKAFKDNEPLILAGWHGGFLLAPALFPNPENLSAMVARHGDAEFIGQILRRFGVRLVRGAGAGGKRKDKGGAQALRLSLKELKAGRSLTMTADVPPGPARKAGLGIITIARLSGRPILPAASATSGFKVLNNWSRFVVNLPFSRLAVLVGDPIHVPRDADAAMMEKKRLELEAAMHRINAEAFRLAGADISKLALASISGPPRPGFALRLYRAAMTGLTPFAGGILKRRQQRGKEDEARRHERLGRPRLPRPDGFLIWIHAASVGETNAVLPLIERLRQLYPAKPVLLTTGTVTSAKIAAQRLPVGALHQYVPLDAPKFLRGFLDHWRPDAALFVESEIWPNMLLAASERRMPLILLNARVSSKSYKSWRKRPGFARPLFGRFDLVLAQNERLRQRFYRLGAPLVEATGNLKLDTPPPLLDEAALSTLRAAINQRPLLLAASTHPGEDELVLRAAAIVRQKFPQLLTIVLPRHPERGGDIAALAEREGLSFARRSKGVEPGRETQVYVADTLGEIGLFYRLADFAFIGGSLIAHGGQNPIEAVASGAKVLTGPHVFNFEEVYEALQRAGAAVTVTDADELAREAMLALLDTEAARRDAEKGREALLPLTGALERTLEALQPYLAPAAEDRFDAA